VTEGGGRIADARLRETTLGVCPEARPFSLGIDRIKPALK
jgi:hypothetical protein